MFTGLITDIGTVVGVKQRGDLEIKIATSYPLATIDIGNSIASDGICLTVTAVETDAYQVQASAETVTKTTVGSWLAGTQLNLERALRVGDELGGHIVSGHVDGVAEVVSVGDSGDSTEFKFRVPSHLARFIASKGSVALNGTSLTVNAVEGAEFSVNIIPHTKAVTTWGRVVVGDKVNLEIDLLARYLARLAEHD